MKQLDIVIVLVWFDFGDPDMPKPLPERAIYILAVFIPTLSPWAVC